jgi:hypothetical protein
MQAHVPSLDAVFPHPEAVPRPAIADDPPSPEESTPVSRATTRARPAVAHVEDVTPSDPGSWTARLLAPASTAGLRGEASRFATGLGLAAIYGLALGTRQGKVDLFTHALGVPAAVLAVALLGVPALYLVLALFDAPVAPTRVLSVTARSVARAGLVMAGLAPASALLVTSSDQPGTAAAAAVVGLAVGGGIGVVGLLRELNGALVGEGHGKRLVAASASLGFAVFAVALAVRIWGSSLSLLGGGR